MTFTYKLTSMHYLIINSRFGSKLLAARLQELRQREAANTSWRSPVRAARNGS